MLSVSFKHSEQKGTTPAPQDAIFTKTVYLRSLQSARLPAAVFYFGAAQGQACAVTGDYPCPGAVINTSAVDVGNASCVLRCNASQPGTETLLLTVIIAQTLHFSYCFQEQFCKLPLLNVIFNRKLGDYYAIRSMSDSMQLLLPCSCCALNFRLHCRCRSRGHLC